MAKLSPDALWSALQEKSQGHKLFAIVDAARHDAIFPLMQSLGVAQSCLYESAPEALLPAAPYLFALERGQPATEALLNEGFGDSWGIFVAAPTESEILRKHFRRFLKVKADDGSTIYFRYYDPRVFRAYLPTCNAEESDYVFGPVAAYLMEDAKGEALLEFRRTPVEALSAP